MEQNQVYTDEEMREFEEHLTQQEQDLNTRAADLQKQRDELERQQAELNAQKVELQQVSKQTRYKETSQSIIYNEILTCAQHICQCVLFI